MSKKRIALSIILLTAALASCVKITVKEPAYTPSGTEPADEPSKQSEPSEPSVPSAPLETSDGPSELPQKQGDDVTELSDDEAFELYFKAREAYGWFDLTTIPFDFENYIETDDGTYYEVIQSGISSKKALADYLNGFFIEDITERLMNESSGRYAEHDGKLYVMPADRGTDILKGEESYELTRISDRQIQITVNVEVFEDYDLESLAGYEQYDFFLEYSDGLWRFTNFELVR